MSVSRSRHPDPESDPDPADPALDQAIKKRRVRTGCLTCRSRKVKCDERRDECDGCTRMGLACRWPEGRATRTVSNGLEDLSLDVTLNRSQPQSAQKRRSSRPRPSCSPQLGLSRLHTSSLSPRRTAVPPSGENHNQDGILEDLDEGDQTAFPTPPVDPALASPLQAEPSIPPVRSRCATSPPPGPCRSTLMDLDRILPKSTLLQAHLNAWFRFVHPCQGSGFLHRGILLRDVREGTASKKLVMAVCAAAGRFFNGASTAMGLDPTKPLKPESWTYHAKNMVLMDEEVSLDNVATCLVLSRHFTHCGRLSLADSLAATATRQAAMIGLLDPATYSSLSWVEQEYRRRLAWACFCFERLAPIGNTVLTHVPRDPVKLQLPTEDHTYQLSIPTETPSADFEGRTVGEGSLNNVGMMGQLVVLLGMQDEASRILHRLRSSPEQSCQPWNPLSPHAMILTRLQQWRRSLPSFLELTADNAYARSLQGEETPLALLHARYHSIMWGLYRVALPGFPESASTALMDLAPQSWIDETRTACMEQARAFGRILALYDQHLPSHVLTDPSLPLMVFEAIRIQAAYALLQPQSEGQKENVVTEAEALCKHVRRSERFFWHSGFMIKAISDFLGRQSMSTTLDPAAAGPAANTAVPVWMRDALLLPSDDSQQLAPDVNVLQTPVNSVIMPAGTSSQGAFTGGFVWDSMTSAGFSVTNPYCNMTGLTTGGGDIMLDAGHIDLVDALFPEVNFGTQFDFGGQTGSWQLQ